MPPQIGINAVQGVMRITLLLPTRPYKTRKKLRTGEKEYTTHRITIPVEAAKKLGLREGATALIVTLEEARWYHLLDWNNPEVAEELWNKLTREQQLRVCQAGLAPPQLCDNRKPITVLAKPEDMESLGLDPGKPVTLEDIIEAVKGKLPTTKPALGK